jgi:hypothetical protein
MTWFLWDDVRGCWVSVYIEADPVIVFLIVKSKKFSWLFSSIVNCMVGVTPLKLLRTSLMFVLSL